MFEISYLHSWNILGYIILFSLWTTVHSTVLKPPPVVVTETEKNVSTTESSLDSDYGKVIKVSPALLAAAKLTVSSTLGLNYSKGNIFIPGNNSNPGGECKCCYHSANEQIPWLEIELPYRTNVVFIQIIGRADFHTIWNQNTAYKETRDLQFVHITIDGEEIPQNLSEYNRVKNILTVNLPSSTIQTVNITRPKPPGRTRKWFMNICEVEFYERADMASGCPPIKDDLDLQWDRGAKGIFTRRKCPDGYKGEAKRYCDEDGMYREPVYNCTSIAVAEIYEQVLNDSVKVEPVTVLEALTNVTSTENESNGSILLGDMNAIIKVMNLIVDAIEQNNYDADIKDLTDSFMQTTSNIIGEGTTATWRSMINETGVGADAILDNVDRFLEKTSNERDTVELVKPNLYIEKEPTAACETGILFPNRSKDKLPEWIEKTRNSISSSCNDNMNTSSFSGIIYRNVSKILPTSFGPERDLQQQLNTPVVSFSYYPKVADKLKNPVEITLQTYDNAFDKPICTFWKSGEGLRAQGYWSRKGCWLHQYNRQDNIVVCKCDHLTNFAVLMSLSPYTAMEHQVALNIITKIGLITSLVFIFLTTVVYCVFWRYVKSVQSIIIMNLSCMLFLAHLLFLTGIDRTGNKIICTAIAALLHFLYLSVFAIMLAQGLELAYTVLKPIHTHTPGLRLLFAFYGISILVVAVTMGVVKLEGCWLSVETGLIWTFLVPVMLVILINLIIMVVVIKTMCGTAYMSKKTSTEKVKSGVYSILVLMPIMGLTWLFGIFSMDEEKVVFQYLFAVFNSLQGVFIFIFHCVLNRKYEFLVHHSPRKSSTSPVKHFSST